MSDTDRTTGREGSEERRMERVNNGGRSEQVVLFETRVVSVGGDRESTQGPVLRRTRRDFVNFILLDWEEWVLRPGEDR